MNRRDLLKQTGVSVATMAALPLLGSQLQADEVWVRIQKLSWAGVKIETISTSILIDPWVSTDSFGNDWKNPVVPIEVANKLRYVLITHLHNDHFDPAAIRSVAKETGFSVICWAPKAAGPASRGLRTYPVQMHEPITLGDVTLWPVPAVDGVQGVNIQVSWIVTAGNKRFIHCGDTLWHGGFWDIGVQYGPFDIAFLPINGATIKGRVPESGIAISMNPTEAIAAGMVMKAKMIVPIHYGVSGEGYVEHPNALAEFQSQARSRSQNVRILKDGEIL